MYLTNQMLVYQIQRNLKLWHGESLYFHDLYFIVSKTRFFLFKHFYKNSCYFLEINIILSLIP